MSEVEIEIIDESEIKLEPEELQSSDVLSVSSEPKVMKRSEQIKANCTSYSGPEIEQIYYETFNREESESDKSFEKGIVLIESK